MQRNPYGPNPTDAISQALTQIMLNEPRRMQVESMARSKMQERQDLQSNADALKTSLQAIVAPSEIARASEMDAGPMPQMSPQQAMFAQMPELASAYLKAGKNPNDIRGMLSFAAAMNPSIDANDPRMPTVSRLNAGMGQYPSSPAYSIDKMALEANKRGSLPKEIQLMNYGQKEMGLNPQQSADFAGGLMGKTTLVDTKTGESRPNEAAIQAKAASKPGGAKNFAEYDKVVQKETAKWETKDRPAALARAKESKADTAEVISDVNALQSMIRSGKVNWAAAVIGPDGVPKTDSAQANAYMRKIISNRTFARLIATKAANGGTSPLGTQTTDNDAKIVQDGITTVNLARKNEDALSGLETIKKGALAAHQRTVENIRDKDRNFQKLRKQYLGEPQAAAPAAPAANVRAPVQMAQGPKFIGFE